MPSLSRRPAWAKRQEVPFAARGLEHRLRVNAHLVKDHRQLVNQSDVQIALCVLNHFGGLGDLNAGRLVRAGGDVELISKRHPW